jgi:hypothetical protein
MTGFDTAAELRSRAGDRSWLWVCAQTPAGLAEVCAAVSSDRWSH